MWVNAMFKATRKIMLREINYMFNDRGMRNIMLWAPLIGILIFAAVYNFGVMQSIPTAIVDLDRSAASRELIQKISQTENLQVTAYPASYAELEEMIYQGQVMTGVVIPSDYGRDIDLKRGTRVFMVIDGSNMVYATNASSAMLEITGVLNVELGVKTLLGTQIAQTELSSPGFQLGMVVKDAGEEIEGEELVIKGIPHNAGVPDSSMTLAEAIQYFQPIEFKEEGWFNPTFNYAYFLLLGLFLNIWQQCCMMASCMNIIGETGMKSWLQFKASGFPLWRFFLSKSLAQIGIFFILALPVYFISFKILHLPLQAHWGVLLLFTLLFVVALHSIGTLMSSLAANSVDATRLGMLVALPSFVISGFTWPLESMPGFMQIIAKGLPQTWFFQGLNYLSFKNPGADFITHYLGAFISIALVCYTISIVVTAIKER